MSAADLSRIIGVVHVLFLLLGRDRQKGIAANGVVGQTRERGQGMTGC